MLPIATRATARTARAAAICVAASIALSTGAAFAQKDDPKKIYEAEVKRIASERASRVRDLLQVVALAARRTHSFTFGKIEASADGETVRIHNVVYTENKLPAPQVIRILEISDFDRLHMIPRHVRIRGDGDVMLSTLPPQVRAIFQQLQLPSLKSFSEIEYQLNEKTGVFELKSFKIAWLGQLGISLKLRLENVPSLNELIEMSVSGHNAEAALQRVKVKSIEVKLDSKTGSDLVFRAIAMFQGSTPARARQEAMAKIDEAVKNAPARWLRNVGIAVRTLAQGPGTATLRIVARSPLSFRDLQTLGHPRDLEKVAKITVISNSLPPDKVTLLKLPEPWQNLPTSDEADPAVHQCDRYGADPADAKRKSPGVVDSNMNRPLAVVTCARATLEFPKASRFQYQLGRALKLAGNRQGAAIWLKKAADADYGAAKAALKQN